MPRSDSSTRVCPTCGHVEPGQASWCGHCGAPMGESDDDAWRVFGVPTPLVGREAALDELTVLVDDAIGVSTPRIITLRGPEGIGRTRVLAALEARLSAARDDRLVLRGTTTGSGPLPALAELLRQRFYLTADGGSDAWRQALADGMQSLLGSVAAADAVDVLSPFVGLAGGDGRPDAERAEQALAAWLTTDARRQPIIVLWDDVDRNDLASARMLVRALGRVADAPVIMILAASDPGVWEALGCGADRSDVREVTLAPLDVVDATRQVEQLLARVDTEHRAIVDWVVPRAGGNPLLAEELVRILIADGAIDTRGDAWDVAPDRLDDSLGGDLEAIVHARLDRLAPNDHALLVRAALIGTRFWTGALRAVERSVDADPADIDALWADLPVPLGAAVNRAAPIDTITASIERLAARDILVPCPQRELPGTSCWAFKHDVERRLLAERASDDTRRRVGTAVGRWLVVHARRGIDIARQAAALFASAGEASRAAALFVQAAREAEARHAWGSAVEHYQRALALLPARDLDLRVETLQSLGDALARAGDFERCIPVYEDVARTAWRLASRRHAADAFDALGRAWRSLGEYDRAKRLFERSLALGVASNDRASSARALEGLGRVAWVRGDYDQAESRYTHALALRRDTGDLLPIAGSLHRLGVLRVERGAFRDALNLFREALAIRREIGNVEGVARDLLHVGDVVLQRGDADTARRVWAEAIAAAAFDRDRVTEAILHTRQVAAAMVAHDLDEAASALAHADRLARATHDARLGCEVLRLRGELDAQQGDRTSAANTLRDAVAEARHLGSPVLEGRALLALATVRGDGVDGSRNPDEADQLFRDAVAALRGAGAEVELGRAWHRYGTWLLEQGLLLKGKKHLAMASELGERLEMRRVLAWSTGMSD